MSERKHPSSQALEAADSLIGIDNGDIYINGENGQILVVKFSRGSVLSFAKMIVNEIGIALDKFAQQREQAAYERGKAEERARVLEALTRLLRPPSTASSGNKYYDEEFNSAIDEAIAIVNQE